MTLFTLLLYLTGIMGFVLLFVWSTYNTCIKLRNQVKTDFSDIDIQLKRRSSLIDNLISLVREYAKHEKTTFENVTKARSALDNSKSVQQTAKAENELTHSLRSLMLVVENYPKLQASQNYQQLRTDLTDTENLIAQYREEYNRSVQKYNIFIQRFPNLLVTKLLGFTDADLYQISQI